ncbi:GIY-YIG nuclease family protein [Candidatus Blastococcus massiliensis]|uniref:GIY-YIG nuclease family protein n=1 Tax=Candidatus Blastococcus massiliensis TaxID=1470358 RepID=UPI00058DACD3|nr:GIY-YIG nuclease family protein [Candidatus Blastococcus massiliensis]
MSTEGPLGDLEPLTIQLQATLTGYFDLRDARFRVRPPSPKQQVAPEVLSFQDDDGEAVPGVYLIALNAIGEYYVGQTKALGRRMREHASKALKVRDALTRERDAQKSQEYAGAELITFMGSYSLHTQHSFDQGSRRPFRPLDLHDLHDRLALEGAALRVMRSTFSGGAVLNALDDRDDDAWPVDS